ncbi:MAG: ribonuclease III domain-containing protein [Candidatus Methylacidiphilales bacterium]|nr:ribonuclease III domain-containing protein [Candidatus Methylacidiphilales bacterium]
MDSEVRDLSWIGDAVLALCARNWIIAHESGLHGSRHDLFRELTCNDFLASFGPPTLVEAELGRIYRDEGLEGARQHFETRLVPVFLKQQGNRNPAAKRR